MFVFSGNRQLRGAKRLLSSHPMNVCSLSSVSPELFESVGAYLPVLRNTMGTGACVCAANNVEALAYAARCASIERNE